jgi:hypothetical protein
MSRVLALSALLLVTASCSARQQQPTQSAQGAQPAGTRAPGPKEAHIGVTSIEALGDPDETYWCEWEKPTGSQIRRKVCRSNHEMETARKGAQEQLTRPRARPDEGWGPGL